jgi:thiosulfate reductase cytochrome b subunit
VQLTQLPVKNNIQVIYMHTRLTMNAVLKDFLQKKGSWLNKTNLLFLDVKK